jgi:hypothetical protein
VSRIGTERTRPHRTISEIRGQSTHSPDYSFHSRYANPVNEYSVPEFHSSVWWLNLAFFSFFAVLAWLFRLEWERRLSVTALGVVAIVVLFLLPLEISPLILMPMAYWQTGLFMAPISETLQSILGAMDRNVFSALKGLSPPQKLQRWLHIYFECAYILVYPMVPSGLIVLYATGHAARAGEFWTVVLPPAYLCYATLPFVRTHPPRVLNHVHENKAKADGIRGFNLRLVGLVTHQANTFPSAHAAAAVAIALELTRLVPWIGVLYLVIAISIMVGAFIGRYHYAADLLAGGALACISFLLTIRW